MASLKWIWRSLRWLFVIVGLATLGLALLLAFPLSQPPAVPSIRAGALAIDQADMRLGAHRNLAS